MTTPRTYGRKRGRENNNEVPLRAGADDGPRSAPTWLLAPTSASPATVVDSPPSPAPSPPLLPQRPTAATRQGGAAGAATISSWLGHRPSLPPPPPSTRLMASPAKPPPLVQLHIDAGQRAFDTARCSSCGMTYCPGDASDAIAHARHCASLGGGLVPWVAHGGDDVVWRGELGGASVRIVHVEGGTGGTRIAAVAALLLRELGPESAPRVATVGEGGDGGGGWGEPHYFCAVSLDGSVVGVAVAQALGRQTLLRATRPRGVGGLVLTGGGSSAAHSLQPITLEAVCVASGVEVTLGIAQLWTAASWRRRGLARSLLDAARCGTLYAYTVPRSELAFTQPTGDGYACAARYLSATEVPTYA